MAILPSRKVKIDRRLEQNDHFALQKGHNGETPRAKWPFRPPEKAKSTDASSEMATFALPKGQNRQTPRAKWYNIIGALFNILGIHTFKFIFMSKVLVKYFLI